MTPGNVHDSRERDTLLLGDENELYAAAPYSSAETRDKLARFGISDRVQRKGDRTHPLSAGDHERNKEIAVTRSGAERPFATYKRLYGLARTRFMGLDRTLTFHGPGSDGEQHPQRCQIPHAIWHSRTGPHRISAAKFRKFPE